MQTTLIFVVYTIILFSVRYIIIKINVLFIHKQGYFSNRFNQFYVLINSQKIKRKIINVILYEYSGIVIVTNAEHGFNEERLFLKLFSVHQNASAARGVAYDTRLTLYNCQMTCRQGFQSTCQSSLPVFDSNYNQDKDNPFFK